MIRKQFAGRPFKLNSSEWNQIASKINKLEEQDLKQNRTRNYVLVYNSESVNCPAHYPIAVGDILNSADLTDAQTNKIWDMNSIVFNGTIPDDENPFSATYPYRGSWGITVEPISAGTIGAVCVNGPVPAIVSLVNPPNSYLREQTPNQPSQYATPQQGRHIEYLPCTLSFYGAPLLIPHEVNETSGTTETINTVINLPTQITRFGIDCTYLAGPISSLSNFLHLQFVLPAINTLEGYRNFTVSTMNFAVDFTNNVTGTLNFAVNNSKYLSQSVANRVYWYASSHSGLTPYSSGLEFFNGSSGSSNVLATTLTEWKFGLGAGLIQPFAQMFYDIRTDGRVTWRFSHYRQNSTSNTISTGGKFPIECMPMIDRSILPSCYLSADNGTSWTVTLNNPLGDSKTWTVPNNNTQYALYLKYKSDGTITATNETSSPATTATEYYVHYANIKIDTNNYPVIFTPRPYDGGTHDHLKGYSGTVTIDEPASTLNFCRGKLLTVS